MFNKAGRRKPLCHKSKQNMERDKKFENRRRMIAAMLRKAARNVKDEGLFVDADFGSKGRVYNYLQDITSKIIADGK